MQNTINIQQGDQVLNNTITQIRCEKTQIIEDATDLHTLTMQKGVAMTKDNILYLVSSTILVHKEQKPLYEEEMRNDNPELIMRFNPQQIRNVLLQPDIKIVEL